MRFPASRRKLRKEPRQEVSGVLPFKQNQALVTKSSVSMNFLYLYELRTLLSTLVTEHFVSC